MAALAAEAKNQALKPKTKNALFFGTAEAWLKPCPDTTPGVQQQMWDTLSGRGQSVRRFVTHSR